jgi:integrase/recombinase XerD
MTFLIDQFLVYIGKEKGLSLNTQEAYERDLKRLYQYTLDVSASFPPSYDTLLQFFQKEKNAGKEESTLARCQVAIKVFLRFLFREGHLKKDLSLFFDHPKLWQKIPALLNPMEIDRLLRAPDESMTGLRDRAILELLYGTGMRVGELCNLKIYDISDDHVKVFGKGSKERLIPLPKKTLEVIDTYLQKVRMNFDSDEEKALFLSSRGKPLHRIKVWKLVKEYAKKVGITKKISPHTFRHSYASHLLDAGADIRVIQELLGHAHISSTDRYTHLSQNEIKEAFRAFHPRWSS